MIGSFMSHVLLQLIPLRTRRYFKFQFEPIVFSLRVEPSLLRIVS